MSKTPGAEIEANSETGENATKSTRTRARILDAAAKVLSVRGYSGMRLSDVAEVAEIQAPAIYYYFGSRDDLIEEVMWVGIADMTRYVEEALAALPADTTAIDRILTAVGAHLRHELEISDYTTASIRNAGQIPESIRTRQREEENRYGDAWRALLRGARDAGELRPGLDLYIVQMLVLGSLNWAVEWWNPERGTVDKIVREAQSFVRGAVAKA